MGGAILYIYNFYVIITSDLEIMQGKFIDLLYSIVIQFRWGYLGGLFLVFFVGSWWATAYFEHGGDITDPSVYWWYFFNNVMRNGYSGYSPVSLGARIVNIFTFFGGGIFFIAAICKITAAMYEQTQRRRKGLSVLKMKDHIVILGYRQEESEEIISQLRADGHSDPKIVLCTRKADQNPLPSFVEFVYGDTASDDVLKRACVAHAGKILIHGHTDERTIAISVAVSRCVRADAHIVVYLEKKSNERFFELLDRRIECVTSLRTPLLAQALLNPGATKILRELVSVEDPGTHFRIDIPADVSMIPFHLLLSILNQEYRAIAIGYAVSHETNAKTFLNPAPDIIIGGGMSLFYIAEHRLDKIIDWNIFNAREVEVLPDEAILRAVSVP